MICSVCPSPERLRLLVLGLVPEADAELHEQHLLECAACCQKIRQLRTDDTLLDALRRKTSAEGPLVDGIDVPGLIHKIQKLGHDIETPTSTLHDAVAEASPPAQVGRYRILEQIGVGGMGAVYKAFDGQLQRTVALKIPRFAGPTRDRRDAAQRFVREGRAAARIRHPNVCPIYDVGEQDGLPYVVMEFVEGQSLADVLAGGRRIEDPRQAVHLIHQIADGLSAVHAHGLIHRDLKPGNILMDHSGRAVLSDFGLARPADDAEHLTATGTLVGTPAYLAPEQASLSGSAPGPAADIYSLGVVLYRMFTGRLPFEGPVLAVIHSIADQSPPPPSQFVPDLDPGIEAIISQAMARRPEERYANAHAMAQALADWKPGATRRPLAPSVGKFKLTRRPPAWMVAAMLLVVGGALVGTLYLVLGEDATNGSDRASSSPLDQHRAENMPTFARFAGQPRALVAAFGTLRNDPVPVRRLLFSPDDRLLASSDDQEIVRLYDAASGKERANTSGQVLAFSPERRLLALTAREGPGSKSPVILRFWDVESRHDSAVVKGCPAPAAAGFFSADGREFVSGGSDGTIQIWNIARSKDLITVREKNRILAVAYDSEEETIVCAESGKTKTGGNVWLVKRLDYLTGRERGPPLQGIGPVSAVAISPDAHKVAWAGEAEGPIRIWDIATAQAESDFSAPGDAIAALAFLPDGKSLVSGSVDGRITLWISGRQKEEWKLPAPIHSLAVASDGRHIAWAGASGLIYVLRLNSRS